MPDKCLIRRYLCVGCASVAKCLTLLNIVDLQNWGSRRNYVSIEVGITAWSCVAMVKRQIVYYIVFIAFITMSYGYCT